MVYQEKDRFSEDYKEACRLGLPLKVGVEVDSEIAWKAYSNSKASQGLELMLFGRHRQAVRQVVQRRLEEAQEIKETRVGLGKSITKEAKRHANQFFFRRDKREKAMLDQLNETILGGFEAYIKDQIDKASEYSIDLGANKDSAMVTNFGIVNNDSLGAILLMGNENWNLNVNDAWLLGSVHANLDFYSASAVDVPHIFDEKHVFTITGRELLGLAYAGYRQHSQVKLGVVFTPGSESEAKETNLVKYQQLVNDLTDRGVEEAKEWFQKKGFTISA